MGQTLDIDSSCVEIARVILRDLGITSQLLKIANSALYKHSDRPIMSVAHAIILLGWDMVRNLLSAIQFVEHFANGSSALRELMLLSVLNAVHSRDIASAAGYPLPDEAYICGLFQNLGEVVVAGYYPIEYARVIDAMDTEKIPARAACMRILDFSWDEVGMQLAQEWNMPSKVRSCLAASCGRGGAESRSISYFDNRLCARSDALNLSKRSGYRCIQPAMRAWSPRRAGARSHARFAARCGGRGQRNQTEFFESEYTD